MRVQEHNLNTRYRVTALLGLTAMIVVLFVVAGLARPAAAAGVIYVDVDAPGPTYDGTSWATAFPNLQDGLAAWTSGDQIWVAEGRYFPDVGASQTLGDRAATFWVFDTMEIYGGFTGPGSDMSNRDPAVHFTVLSGDIDKNDQLVDLGIAPPGVTPRFNDIVGNNSYHVIENKLDAATGNILQNTIVLDGLIITAGDAILAEPNTNPVSKGRGGGARFNFAWEPGSLIMRNVQVRGNRGDLEGGGIHQVGGGLEITDSDFIFNAADDGDCVNLNDDFGRTWGGGLMTQTNIPNFDQGYDPIRKLENVSFVGNFAEFGGGYMNFYANDVSPPRSNQTLKNVHFDANRAIFQGGGMYNFKTSPTLEHVFFTGNIVESCATVPPVPAIPPPCNPIVENCGRFTDIPIWGGGGLFNLMEPGVLEISPGPKLTNVQFSGNRANIDGASCTDHDGFGGAMINQNSNTTLNNVLLSGNLSENSGGALYNVVSHFAESDHTIAINNATFAGNSNVWSKVCGQGMALAQANLANVNGKLQNITIKNSILWGPYQSSLFPIYDFQLDPTVPPSTPPDTLRNEQSIVEGCGDSGAGWSSGTSLQHCGVDDGGNVDADPLFVQDINFINAPTLAGNFRLQGASPALDTGNDALIPAGVTTDLDGNPRVIDGDGNGVPIVDRGAYEHLGCPTTVAGTIFVNWQATGANNGLTWDDAFINLQDAIDLYAGCTARAPVKEIWVAQGAYYPDLRTGVSPSLPASVRSAFSFHLLNNGNGGVQIYGGFVGGEDAKSKRDWVTNVTVLSGDIEHDDNSNGDGVVPSPDQITGVNSQHVVQDVLTNCNGTGCPVLDGFTITGGRAFLGDESVKTGQGGGMWAQGGSSILQNLIFQGNQAYRGGGFYEVDTPQRLMNSVRFENNWARTGGGMAVEGESNISLDGVTFQSNQAKLLGSSDPDSANGGGMYFASTFSNTPIDTIGLNFFDNTADSSGGGLYTTRPFDFNVQLRLQQPVFQRNQAGKFGGAMANEDSSPYVDLGFFQGNQAQIGGGSISNRNGSDLVIFDSLLSGNHSVDGGGMYNKDSSPELTNVTFSGNRADGDGGAIKNEGTGTADIRNTIAWQNSSGISSGPDATPVMSFSLIQGCTVLPDSNCPADGGGNLEPNNPADPVFVAPINPNTAPSTAGDFHLDINSEVIDVGNNAYNDHYAALGGVEDSITPIAPRKLDGNGDGTVTIDMGAYEAPAAGRIIVVKETQPAGVDEAFFFELTPPQGEKVGFVLQDGENFNSLNLTPGTYSVVETEDPEWYVHSATCDDQSDPSNIDLQGGTTVTCTFVNRPKAVITESYLVSSVEEGKFSGVGSRACYWITLVADPGPGEVVVNVEPSQNGEVTVNKSSVTLNGSNWNNLSTSDWSNFVCVRAVDDKVDDGGAKVCRDGNSDIIGNGSVVTDKECGDHKDFIPHSVASSTASGYDTNTPIIRKAPDGQLTSPSTIDVLIKDDDEPGVVLTESYAVTDLDEDGSPVGKACYWVTLASQPSAPVTVKMSGDTEVKVDKASVILTASNWRKIDATQQNTFNRVCATPVDESIADPPDPHCFKSSSTMLGQAGTGATVCGDHLGHISHTVTSGDSQYDGTKLFSGNGPNYDGKRWTIDALIRNDDVAKVNLTPLTLNLLEGSKVNYEAVLTSQPQADVVVQGETGTLTFKRGSWDQPQILTFKSTQDDQPEGPQMLLLDHQVSSTDGTYHGLSTEPVELVVVDDDHPGVLLSTAEVSLAEGGQGRAYEVVLTTPPAADVIVAFMAGDQLNVQPGTLTFNATNWQTAQIVTVSAVNDNVAEDAQHSARITHHVSSSDADYEDMLVVDVTADILDNDDAAIAISESELAVDEGGSSANYTVVLQSKPAAAVIVTMDGARQIKTQSEVLEFNDSNWDQPQTVRVQAIDDAVDEAQLETVVLTHQVTSADSFYNRLPVESVNVEVADNDQADIVLSTINLQVPRGHKAAYTVALASKPEAPVVIDLLTSEDLSAKTVSCDLSEAAANCLTFTLENWDAAQTVTVRGSAEGQIEHRVSSTDSKYDGLQVKPVKVAIGGKVGILMPLILH